MKKTKSLENTVSTGLSDVAPERFAGDAVVFFVYGETLRLPGETTAQQALDRAVTSGDFGAREGESLLFYAGAGLAFTSPRVAIVGLGKRERLVDPEAFLENFRKAGGTAALVLLKTKARRLFLVPPPDKGDKEAAAGEGLIEGCLLGAYQFRRYKTKKDPDNEPGGFDSIMLCGRGKKTALAVQRGTVAAFCCNRARDMANEPANRFTPASFATEARRLARDYAMTAEILGPREMKELGMGGIMGVSAGTAAPPLLAVVTYRSAPENPTLLLVGKGLTFDSGGISIKPAAGMENMKMDMCGGAAVMAVMEAMGRERPAGVNVVGMVPAAENLIGPAAIKPGDVISIYGGKTVEVVNTDAEGRLILADALAYGIERYKPAVVVDIATLTGAVIVGLGHHASGLLANDDALAARIVRMGRRAGEPCWRLPLGPEYAKMMESKIADLKNAGDRSAGTVTAAAFLQNFVGDTPWAHLDIAGTAWDFSEKSYMPKGPSGVGVRTLIELVRHWK